MKIKNKSFGLKRLSAALFAIVVVVAVFAQLFQNSLDASAISKDEAGVRQLFYRNAVYECLTDNPEIIKTDVSVGQPISSIFNYDVANWHYGYAGSWIGDHETGTVTCWDAIQNAGFTGNITEEMLKSGKILDGVYEKVASTEKKLYCGYNILLENESGYFKDTNGNNKVFWWPQGFNKKNGNSTGLSRVGFYYNNDGWVNKGEKIYLNYQGVDYDIDTYEQVSNYTTFDSSNFKQVCHDIVTGISVLGHGNITSDGLVQIQPVKNTGNDETPLAEWGPAGWVHDYKNAADTYVGYMYYESEDTGKSTALARKDGAATALKANLKKIWFDSKEPKDYFDGIPDLQYIVYGRVLFNGDGGYTWGCNGLSLEATDENKEWASNQSVWNLGNDYVKTTKAYKKKTDSSKTEFITKFGYGGKNDSGYMATPISVLPWEPTSFWKCEDLVGWFNNTSASSQTAKQAVITYMGFAEDPEEIKPPVNPDEPNNPDNPDDGQLTDEQILEEACYREAKSLGWIICPIIFGLQETSSRIYEKIEPMVRVNDSVLGQMSLGNQGQGAMFKAWNTFRGIANVIFVILFLFIIFSQLTGIGIDNYGIKKMLPKVIVTAILVNISFLICAVAVDISNILGKSLQDLLVSLAPSSAVMGSGIVEGTTSTINAAVNIIFIFASVGAGAVAFYLNGWALIIPILLFLITMIISIIFALIVLGLRQAFVVILVVVSPIAFACTLLPNTESVFKKWKEFFKQILMVYPIVGGLIGAGYFVARLIWVDNTDLIMTVTAGMLCVAPYFLVPSLTRKSLDMAGKLGERLQGFGRNANRRINDIGRSDAARNARANSRAGRDESRAQRWMNSRRAQKIQDDMAAGKTISRRRANKYAQKAALATQSRQASIAARSAQTQYGRLNSQSGYQAALSAANMSEDAITTKNFETMLAAGNYKYTDASGQEVSVDSQNNDQIAKALEHELKQDLSKYDANKVRALTNTLASKGKEGRSLMFDAVKNAQDGGATSQAIKDFAGNIMSNHAGTMKEKHRSLYEFAKNVAGMDTADIANRGANNISKYAANGVGSLNASDMTNMDIQQLQRYRENVSSEVNPKTGKSDQQILAGLANDALTDEHLSQNLSDKTRTELQKIAQMGGYSPVTPQPSDLKVDHTVSAQTEAAQAATANAATVNAEAVVDAARTRADNGRHALDEYTESVIRRVESGDIKADDGERMIQHAEEHIRNKYGNGGKA